MNFTELVNAVCSEVNRPDFTFEADGGTGEAPRAILGSILTLHMRETYWRDIRTVQAVFDTSAYIQSVELSILPRFRKMNYVRKWDAQYQASQVDPAVQAPSTASATRVLGLLDQITPDNIKDAYGYERTDVWYAAGSTLFIKSSTLLARALIGYYAQPNLISGTDGRYAQMDSWIAKEYPFAVIYHASGKLYSMSGQQDMNALYNRPPSRGDEGGLTWQQIAIIDRNNILAG